jgi:hypothetical protein
MPFDTIDHAALITFRLQQTFDGELWQFGAKCYERDPADIDDLLASVLSWITTGDLIMEHTTLTGITYSEWGSSGFTGFHQAASILTSHSFSSGNQLPPQCAVVASLLNTTVPGVSIKRRRGRIYFGQIPVAFVDGDGQLNSTALTTYQDSVDGLQDALLAVPAVSGAPVGMDGLCIASPAEGSLLTADSRGVGLAVDTQRRRRRKRVESITYVALPT